MIENLRNSMNTSNEFRTRYLDDPINYNVPVRDTSLPGGDDIPERYKLKERVIKERESLGGFRFPMEELKKRTNPSDEYYNKEFQLRNALDQRKQLLANYTERQPDYTYDFGRNNNLISAQDINFDDLDINHSAPANDNLLKLLDFQVNQLKKESIEQMNRLNRQPNDPPQYGFDLNEPKVTNHFIVADNDRVQSIKHVQTLQKPEYMSLEELQRERMEHEKKLREIEDEYYNRKSRSKSVSRASVSKPKPRGLYQTARTVQQQIPLTAEEQKYANKFQRYKNQKNAKKLGYEEEWNNTKIKSMNSNGVVNRTDGLPGYLDRDDYELYYYNIMDEEKKKNKFERPILSHKHTGKEKSLQRTFRNDPGYTTTSLCNIGKITNNFNSTTKSAQPKNLNASNTKGISTMQKSVKFDHTFPADKGIQESQNFRNLNQSNNSFQNQDMNRNLNQSSQDFPNQQSQNFPNQQSQNFPIQQSQNFPNQQSQALTNSNAGSQHLNATSPNQLAFIKMIYGMLQKTQDGHADKKTILHDMNLDESSIKELGFENEADFKNKLNSFPTKDNEYMSEEEFTNFLLSKGENPNLQSQNYYLPNSQSVNNYQDFYNQEEKKANLTHGNNDIYEDDTDDELPGLKTNTLDFLKKETTKGRLREFNRSFNLSSSLPHHAATEGNQSMLRTKSQLNFTVPKPFSFLKNNYQLKKLNKIKEILEDRMTKESKVFNKTFHANPLNKKMFNKGLDLGNVIQREKKQRKERTDKLKQEIIANMKPFSFYAQDEAKYKEKLKRECMPPQFQPFKANPIQWKSQVNMYDGIIRKDEKTRAERIHERALQMFNEAKLPPRMEMHEKNKRIQEQEKKLIHDEEELRNKNKKDFIAKEIPNFVKLQEKFLTTLEKKKKAAQPTVPKPFTFHEPKRKAELCEYLDYENDPQAKNPQNRKDIDQIIAQMQRKPAIEPATTKALSLLMETRRKEIEERKRKEERAKYEDEQRKIKQDRLKERVQKSKAMVDNRRALEKRRDEGRKAFQNKVTQDKKNYQNSLDIINQKVANRPLMLETVFKNKDYISMGQDLKEQVNKVIEEGREEERGEEVII